jgi:drug/metabolite transporter (DMT)-like permease
VTATITARDVIILVLVMIAWGGAFTAGRVALRDQLSPYAVAALRYMLASVFLLAVLASREGLRQSLSRMDRRGWLFLALLSLFGVFGYNVLLLAGLRQTTAVNGSLIAGLAPLATASLAAALLRERLRRIQVIGMLVSLSGVAVLVTRGSLFVLVSLEISTGDLLILLAMVSFGLQSVCARKVSAYLSAPAMVTHSCLLGTAMLLPFVIEELGSTDLGALSTSATGAIVYLGIAATVLAYLGWFHVIGRLGAARPAPFINLVPIFGVAIGLAWGEQFLPAHAVAAALVVGGVHIASRRARVPPVREAPPRRPPETRRPAHRG